MKKINRALAVAAVSATAVGATLLAPAIASASPADDAYLGALDGQLITYPSDSYAISTGHDVCSLLDDGASTTDVALELSNNSGLELEDTGFIVGASIGAYCPWNG